MWDTNPWARWGLTFVTRDGLPMVTETGLWYLAARHPEAVERVSDDEYVLRLERTYRARRAPGRSFFALVPAGERARAA